MSKTKNEFAPEIRERAVRMVLEHEKDFSSRMRAGVPTDVAERLKALERESRELHQANEILRKASAYLPRRRSTARSSDDRVH